MGSCVVVTPRREARLAGASLALALLLGTGCGGGGTDSRTAALDGDYALLTVDGANLPAVVQAGLVSEMLLSARLEIRGTAVRDIKERRLSNAPSATLDTADLTLVRVDDRTFLTRPSALPAAQPDTASLADGVVPNGLLTMRTRSAPSNPSGTRKTLVYARQR